MMYPFEWTTQSLVDAAGGYIQLATLLGGFAFAAITLVMGSLLDASDTTKARFTRPLSVLVSVLFAFLMVAYLYAELGGVPPFLQAGQEPNTKVFALGSITGLIFGVSVVQMFYGLILLFEAYEMPGEHGIRLFVLRVVELLAICYLFAVVWEADAELFGGPPPWALTLCFALVVGCPAGVAVIGHRRRDPSRGHTAEPWLAKRQPWLVAGVTAIAGLSFLVVNLWAVFPRWSTIVILVFLGVVIAGTELGLPPPRKGHSGQVVAEATSSAAGSPSSSAPREPE